MHCNPYILWFNFKLLEMNGQLLMQWGAKSAFTEVEIEVLSVIYASDQVDAVAIRLGQTLPGKDESLGKDPIVGEVPG